MLFETFNNEQIRSMASPLVVVLLKQKSAGLISLTIVREMEEKYENFYLKKKKNLKKKDHTEKSAYPG